MKKLVFVFALVSVLAVSGCGKSGDIVSSSESSVSSSSTEEAVSSEKSEEISEVESSSDESDDNVGGEDWCFAHNLIYHSFDPLLVDYVGMDNFEEWLERDGEECSANIVSFVQDFQIPEDVLRDIVAQSTAGIDDAYYEETGLTPADVFGVTVLSDEQIDAIYSGDEAKIETAFAGYLAADAEDGSRYSLTWLESHTPEEYAAVGIEPQSVEEMVSKIETDDEYKKYRAEVSVVSEQMTEAEAMMAE